jgi:hypothetical protein
MASSFHEVDEEGEGGIDHHRPQDLMFDPWLTLRGSQLQALCDAIISRTLEALRPIGRRPRADLVSGIAAIVPTLIANLLALHKDRPDGSRLVIQMERRKKTRYDRQGFRKLPEIVSVLKETAQLTVHPAVFKQRRTAIEAAGELKQTLLAPDIKLSDLTRAEGEEIIQLTARPKVRRIGGARLPNVFVDFEDTKESIKLRKELEEINSFLSRQEILLQGDPKPSFRLVRRFSIRAPDDPVVFKYHGRLYGGWWMNLKASERHRIRINGEPIADLDYASMFPRLAYREVGQEPPEGDLYAIPGLEAHREGAKAGLSAMLSYSGEMKSLPPRLKQLLPEGWTARRLRKAIADHHPHLVPYFEKDFGLDLMYIESRILLAAMRRLMEMNIPALPMHDGMMVTHADAGAAVAAMTNASEVELGIRLPISKKRIACSTLEEL